MPSFTTQTDVTAAPADVFAAILDLRNWPLFRGYGPLPGIVEATVPEGTPITVGTRIRVRNTDGSVHHERVVELDPGVRYRVTMELVPPAAWWMARIDELVELEPHGTGTRMRRRFDTVPRFTLAWPVVWAITQLLKRAVERHNDAVRAAG